MLMFQKAQGVKSEGPQIVDVALYEGVFSLLESLVPDYDAYGMIRKRTGGALPGVVPTGSYLCGDDLEVVIGGNSNSVFIRLMKAIGREDLAADATLLTTEGRGAREEELNGAIADWTGSMPLAEVLTGAGCLGRSRRTCLRRPFDRQGRALPGPRHDPDPRGRHRWRTRTDPLPRRGSQAPGP